MSGRGTSIRYSRRRRGRSRRRTQDSAVRSHSRDSGSSACGRCSTPVGGHRRLAVAGISERGGLQYRAVVSVDHCSPVGLARSVPLSPIRRSGRAPTQHRTAAPHPRRALRPTARPLGGSARTLCCTRVHGPGGGLLGAWAGQRSADVLGDQSQPFGLRVGSS